MIDRSEVSRALAKDRDSDAQKWARRLVVLVGLLVAFWAAQAIVELPRKFARYPDQVEVEVEAEDVCERFPDMDPEFCFGN